MTQSPPINKTLRTDAPSLPAESWRDKMDARHRTWVSMHADATRAAGISDTDGDDSDPSDYMELTDPEWSIARGIEDKRDEDRRQRIAREILRLADAAVQQAHGDHEALDAAKNRRRALRILDYLGELGDGSVDPDQWGRRLARLLTGSDTDDGFWDRAQELAHESGSETATAPRA